MKVIQIRGCNACGKTTVIKQFLKTKQFKQKKYKKINYYEGENIIVLGDYSKDGCCGCDVEFSNKVELFDTILWFVKNVKPKYLIFEGLIYGVTFEFSYKLKKYLEKNNCDYKAIYLTSDIETIVDRLKERNKGKEVNYEHLVGKYQSSEKAYYKLKINNVDIVKYDVKNIKKEDMFKLLEVEINE